MKRTASADLTIKPVSAECDGAMWIGEVWVDALDTAMQYAASRSIPSRCVLEGSAGFRRARLSIRGWRAPLGFLELTIDDGAVDLDELWCRVEDLRRAPECC